MIARLQGGVVYNGSFDIPEVVEALVSDEIRRLSREFGVSIQKVGTHVHDRGHRLSCFTVRGRGDVDKIARYLDSLGYHLYADFRGLDASRWKIHFIEES